MGRPPTSLDQHGATVSLPEFASGDTSKVVSRLRVQGIYYKSSEVLTKHASEDMSAFRESIEDENNVDYLKPHETVVILDGFDAYVFQREFGDTEWEFTQKSRVCRSPHHMHSISGKP